MTQSEMKDRLIAKQKELLRLQKESFIYEMTGEGIGLDWNYKFIPIANKLESEIASLESEIKQELNIENCSNNCVGPDCEGCRNFSPKPQEPDKTAKEFFNNQISTDADKCFVDVYAHKYDREDLFRFAEAYARKSQITLRDELIKYTIWHEELLYKCHALEEAIAHGVDEYLKHKDNGNRQK